MTRGLPLRVRSMLLVDLDALRQRVDAEFRDTGSRTPPWPDPHPDRQPADEEYSRVSDPGKYRIIGARADAWLRSLAGLELAGVEDVDDPAGAWRDEPTGGAVARARRVRPVRAGALPLLVCTSGFAGVSDNGVLIGVGDPALQVATIPDCGCDACDSGSADLLAELDRLVLDVVGGQFIHVVTSRGTVTAGSGGWSATGFRGGGAAGIERVLADARLGRSRHQVLRGAPWC